VLRTGQEGTYRENQMSTVDYGYRLRLLPIKSASAYAIKKPLKEMVHCRLSQSEDGIPASAERCDLLPQRHDVFR